MAARHAKRPGDRKEQFLFSVWHRRMVAASMGEEKRAGSLPPRLALYRLLSLALGFALNCFHERRPKPIARRPERLQARPSAIAQACDYGARGRWNLQRQLLVAPCSQRRREFGPRLADARVSVGNARNP